MPENFDHNEAPVACNCLPRSEGIESASAPSPGAISTCVRASLEISDTAQDALQFWIKLALARRRFASAAAAITPGPHDSVVLLSAFPLCSEVGASSLEARTFTPTLQRGGKRGEGCSRFGPRGYGGAWRHVAGENSLATVRLGLADCSWP